MKKDKKYGFIYITTNLINGRKYIGQKKYDKDGEWKNYLGSGTIIKQAIKKYGKENFQREIIEECETSKELNIREVYWINFYNAKESEEFYNMVDGGGNPPVNTKGYNYKSRKLICLNDLKIFNSYISAHEYYGCYRISIRKCCTGETLRTLSNDGNWLTFMFYEDYINNSQEYIDNRFEKCMQGCIGEQHANYGRKRTAESIQKQIEARKLKKYDYSDRYKSVICLTTNKIFQSMKDAQEYYNISSVISQQCSKIHTHAGEIEGKPLVWMYYDEYLTNKEKVKIKLNDINTIKLYKRKVKCINTGKIFESLEKARIWCGLKGYSNISSCCVGKRKSAGKHPITGEKLIWEFI